LIEFAHNFQNGIFVSYGEMFSTTPVFTNLQKIITEWRWNNFLEKK